MWKTWKWHRPLYPRPHRRLNAPVIVQTTSGTLKYAPPAVFAGMVERLAQRASVPVALHLDHGSSLELAKECIAGGVYLA